MPEATIRLNRSLIEVYRGILHTIIIIIRGALKMVTFINDDLIISLYFYIYKYISSIRFVVYLFTRIFFLSFHLVVVDGLFELK